MSNTSVKVKASQVRSRHRDAPDKLAGTGAGGTPAVMAKSEAPIESVTTKLKQENAQGSSDMANRPKGASVTKSIREDVKPYLEKHGYALAYGAVGLVAAILILTIGFWPVLLLAALAALGMAIGRYRDGDPGMRARAHALAGFLRR